MELTAFQVHKGWVIKAALVLVVTGLAEAVTGCFAQRPILWCTLIASTLPLSMIVFVLFPLLRQETNKS